MLRNVQNFSPDNELDIEGYRDLMERSGAEAFRKGIQEDLGGPSVQPGQMEYGKLLKGYNALCGLLLEANTELAELHGILLALDTKVSKALCFAEAKFSKFIPYQVGTLAIAFRAWGITSEHRLINYTEAKKKRAHLRLIK